MPETDERREGLDRDAWIGRVIDERYRVLEVLGEGGMGAVLAAEHVGLRKHVAIKVILPRHAQDAELVERFAREALVTARLEHPNVASAIDCGTLPEGGSYLVLQLARGSSLRTVMAERPGWQTALTVGLQMADALAFAHASNIVHRDLKPENVVVEERGNGGLHVWILDFGIARVQTTETALTRLGTIMGTPGYMAPEQAVGQPVDARADVYSLGVILWEIATGRALFDAPDLAKLMEAQLLSTPPRVATLVPGVPPALDALIARMLEPSKAKRPASGTEILDALRAIDAAKTTPAVAATIRVADSIRLPPRSTAAATVVDAARSVPPRTSRASTEKRTTTPLPTLVAAAGAALTVLVALVVLGSCIVSRACAGATDSSVPPPPVSPLPAGSAARLPARPDVPPPPLQTDLGTLEQSPDAAARREAAGRLAARRRELPAYAQALVTFELTPECGQRKQIIKRIREIGDPAALPALARISNDEGGCGPRGDEDCNHCLRRELSRTIERLSEDGEEGD